MKRKISLILLLILLLQNLNGQERADRKLHKIVCEYCNELRGSYSLGTKCKYNYDDYNIRIQNLLETYKPTKKELKACFHYALQFDETNSWCIKFYQMGVDLRDTLPLPFYLSRTNYSAIKNYRFLLDSGIDVAQESKNFIEQARNYYIIDINIWKELIEKGLDKNIKDDSGYSILIGFCQDIIYEDIELLKLFIDSGFDYTVKPKYGLPLLSYAEMDIPYKTREYLRTLIDNIK